MINTSTERLIPLRQLPAPAIPGREGEPVRPCTLRVGVLWGCVESASRASRFRASTTRASRRGIAFSRPSQQQQQRARPHAANRGLPHTSGAGPGPAGNAARLRTECRDAGEMAATASLPDRQLLLLLSDAGGAGPWGLPHRQLNILLALESLTRDKNHCFLGSLDFARLTALPLGVSKALADLLDQLRGMTRRLEVSGKHGPLNVG